MQQPVQNLENKIKELWPKDGPSSQEVKKYIEKYSREKIVIKCGGKVLLDQSLLNNLIEDVVILKKLGLTPILVHGGGLGIKKKLDEQNIKSEFIMGLRVTDKKMINIVESVMTDFNKEIVNALEKKSCKAKSITIKKNNIIYVEQENKELGYVGKPIRVDAKLLKEIIKEESLKPNKEIVADVANIDRSDFDLFVLRVHVLSSEESAKKIVTKNNEGGFPAFTEVFGSKKNLHAVYVGPFIEESDINQNIELIQKISESKNGEISRWKL